MKVNRGTGQLRSQLISGLFFSAELLHRLSFLSFSPRWRKKEKR